MSQIDVVEPVRRPGQFVKGHTIKSPGRPPKPKVDYLPILRECVTEEEHRAIVRRAILDARNGSYRAREWLYKHLISPVPRVAQLEFSEPHLNFENADLRPYLDAMANAEFQMFMRVIDRVERIRNGSLVRPKGWRSYVPKEIAHKIALREMTLEQAKPHCEGPTEDDDSEAIEWLKEELAQ